MRKQQTRKDGDAMSPEAMAAAVEAFKQRRAERMGAAGNADEDAPAENTVPEKAADAEGEEAAPAEAPAEAPAKEPDTDAVQAVKDRRDRRDAEGDPDDMDKAMGVIAQQDEDIDTLLGIIDVLKSAGVSLDAEDENGTDCKDGDDTACADGDEPAQVPAAPGEEKKDRADSASEFRELLRVVRIGDRLNMDGLEGMSVKGAKKAILKKLKPELRLDGKSSVYVSAAFDMAVAEMNARKDTNYQRRQMTRQDSASKAKSVGSATDARQHMIDRLMQKEEK